jgi:hypothetical protein
MPVTDRDPLPMCVERGCGTPWRWAEIQRSGSVPKFIFVIVVGA